MRAQAVCRRGLGHRLAQLHDNILCLTLHCRDEQNLEENERIKKELNPRKIGEVAGLRERASRT